MQLDTSANPEYHQVVSLATTKPTPFCGVVREREQTKDATLREQEEMT